MTMKTLENASNIFLCKGRGCLVMIHTPRTRRVPKRVFGNDDLIDFISPHLNQRT